ncbi:MAG TPA: SgcJ/EcaC family oxidoreductase [Polyangiaceae bacterium]|nr:SgcJ/EcaC family oxidoreductase [Polyangiaceae bacterium]
MTQDERAIRDLIDRWHEYAQQGNVDATLRLMTDDVVFTVVGSPPFGKARFESAAREMQGAKLHTEHELLELTVSGDSAWSRVRLRVTVTKPDGQTLTREGHTLSIYVRGADGGWLLARDANLLGPPQSR